MRMHRASFLAEVPGYLKKWIFVKAESNSLINLEFLNGRLFIWSNLYTRHSENVCLI